MDLRSGDIARWTLYWRRNPIAAWTGEKRDRRTWFRANDDRFTLDLAIASKLVPTFTQMTRELVDYRLAQYLARKRRSDVSSDYVATPRGIPGDRAATQYAALDWRRTIGRPSCRRRHMSPVQRSEQLDSGPPTAVSTMGSIRIDTFVFKDGKIVIPTVRYTVTRG